VLLMCTETSTDFQSRTQLIFVWQELQHTALKASFTGQASTTHVATAYHLHRKHNT